MSAKLEIIMFNMSSYSEWQRGVANRNYHIFRKLLESETVGRIICVDFLPFTFRRALRNYWENNIRKLKVGNLHLSDQQEKSEVPDHLTRPCQMIGMIKRFGRFGRSERQKKPEVIYRDLTTKCVKIDGYPAELYVFSTIDSIFSHKLVIKKLNKVLNKINQQSTINNQQSTIKIVWSYFPMFVDYFSAKGGALGGDGIRADLTIFDAVDNWIEHPSFIKYRELLERNYRIIAEKSDLIFTVAENLIEFFKSFGRKKDVHWIPNGVDAMHFIASQLSVVNKIPRPIIGYVGTIQHRVDVCLLEYLAKNNPDKSFVLIGPLWPVFLRKLRRPAIEIKKLKKYKNVYLLGRKSWEIAPAYIKKFDVGISPHKLDKFAQYTNSLKVLEYLACGIPVVTTPSSGVERFSHLIYLAQDYQDFNRKIDLAIENDTMELREQRIARAKQEDWNLKVGEMMKYITNHYEFRNK